MGNTEGSSDISSNRQKVDTEVKEGVVIGLNAIVLQWHSSVELGTRVHLKLACSDIHNVGDAQLDQFVLVPGCVPGRRAQGGWEVGVGLSGSALAELELAPFPPLPSPSSGESGLL